jgi:integrase
MSIRKEARQKGNVYVVRVYDPTRRSGYREKTFTLRSDAVAWEAQFNLAKRRGSLSELDAGKETLGQFVNTWRTQYAALHLAPATRAQYERYLKNDIIPKLGTVPLRSLSTGEIAAFIAGLDRGVPTVRKVSAVLQGVLSRAVEWGYIPTNPALGVRKPRARRLHRVGVTPAEKVEALCGKLNERGALLVRLLSYAGLRPAEALALTWGDISDTAISVTKAVALGEVKETKTGHSRLVRLDPQLRVALTRGDTSVLREGAVLPAPGGGVWSSSAYRNWRRRVFKPKAEALGISPRPYDLRHTYASRLFAAGEHPKYVAEQMGHSLETLLSTYIHVMDSEGKQKKSDTPRRVNASQTA